MPFLHLDKSNLNLDMWKKSISNLEDPKIEIIIWDEHMDLNQLQKVFPFVDFLIFPRRSVSITAAILKLFLFGGIVIRGYDVEPDPYIENLFKKWNSEDNFPKTLSIKKNTIYIDHAKMMCSEAGDPTCERYLKNMMQMMEKGIWEYPSFERDVQRI